MSQTILVTGSNSGFGRLISETLARQGYTVFAGMRGLHGKNARSATEIRNLAAQEHLTLQPIEIDIVDDQSVQKAIDEVVKQAGRLDVVVNNAGVSYSGPLEAFTIEQVQQQFDTNVFGVMRVNRAVLPQMKAQKSGLLIQIGSIVGRLTLPFMGLYGASKFALEALTAAYRYELAAFGIDAVIIEPGTFPTTIASNRVVAADTERLAPYALLQKTFVEGFSVENRSTTPPDPQDVADAIAGLIAQPAGERPLNVVVAVASQREFPMEVNEVVTKVNTAYLEKLNILPQVTLTQTSQVEVSPE